jgi:hypothetical protein
MRLRTGCLSHVLYSLQQPGVYAVRWIYERPNLGNEKVVMDSTKSAWTTFTVSQATTLDHERWLSRLVASSPTDPGLLAGDYLPSLVAAAPDERALQAIAAQLYSSNPVVSGLAASELGAFPEDRVRDLILESIQKRGPTNDLAQLVSYNAFGLYSDPGRQRQIARDCFEYLRSTDPAKAAAAITMIRYTVHLHPDQTDPRLAALADEKVLEASPDIIAANHDDPKRELAMYLGLFKSHEAHPLLWRIASSGGYAADQARDALLFHPEPDDLPKVEALLLQPGNSDPNGSNLSGLPKSLMLAFGDKAVPVLRKALSDSPYVWVRTSSAQELLRKNDPAAFHFFLDALVNNRWSSNLAYKGQLIRDVGEVFPTELPNGTGQKAVTNFLRARLARE